MPHNNPPVIQPNNVQETNHINPTQPKRNVPASTNVSNKKVSLATLSLDDLDDLDVGHENKEVLTQPQTINEVEFADAWQNMLSQALASQFSLASILQSANYRIEGNVCIYTVNNVISRQHILHDREQIHNYLRQACNNPSILIEVEVIEDMEIQNNDMPVTEEEKKRWMEEKNPYFKLFIEKLGNNLAY